MDQPTFLSLIPALATLIIALVFKRTFEGLLGGCAIGFLQIEVMKWTGHLEAEEGYSFVQIPLSAFKNFISTLSETMADGTIVWIILVVGLFGSLIALLVRAGGALAFGEMVASKVSSKRGALLVAWVLGICIFIDDYLNALTVSSAMRKVTDKYKTSREMLAYVVDSTAAPVCVLLPLSTWAIFTAGLLEGNGVAEPGEGLFFYFSLIPYNLYAIFALVMVLLVILGVVPKIGPMKAAEERAEKTGECVPPGSESMTMIETGIESALPAHKANAWSFVLPIFALLLFSWLGGIDFSAEKVNYLGAIDALMGVIMAIIVTSLLYIVQRITSINDFSNTFFKGFQSMVYPLAIVVMSFVLVSINETLGLTEFIIQTMKPMMQNTAALLPMLAFISMAFVAFSTGSFWGMFAVTLPVIIPLSAELDVSTSLSVGAVISAGAFGSHLCPFGDATVLSSAGCGCDNFRHVATQMPYGLICGALAALGYLILGFVL